MNKKILAMLAVLVVLGSVYQLTSRSEKPGENKKPGDKTAETEETEKKDDQTEKEEKEEEEVVEKEASPMNFEDQHFLEEKDEEMVVRLRGDEFIYGIKNTDAGHMWNFKPLVDNEYEVVELENHEEIFGNPEESLMEYVPVKEAYPNGLTFVVIGDKLTLSHGDESLGTFNAKETHEFGGR